MAIKRFKTSLFSQPKQYGVSSGKGYNNPSATGGTMTYAGGYSIHTFTTVGSNSFTITQGVSSVEYLIVAGGASGSSGTYGGAGGGAGGLLSGTSSVTGSDHTIIVGDRGPSPTVYGAKPASGGANTSALGLTAIGGGRGGSASSRAGELGGSGGGGGPISGGTAGAATAGQGNSGGAGSNGNWAGGGGGGAGGAGAAATVGSPYHGGNGGAALSNSISGTAYSYCGGGGGHTEDLSGITGLGGTGAGNAGQRGNYPGGNATNYGAGGGGGGNSPITLGEFRGFQGIVILRYLTAPSLSYD